MAKKVKAFPEPIHSSKYPWVEWLDGGVWELVPGKDFEGKPTNFRSAAISQARNRGGRVKTQVQRGQNGSERMYLQFFREESDPDPGVSSAE